MSRKPRERQVTADYVNGLLHEIVKLKERNKKLEDVYTQVKRLTMTAIVDDDFPEIKADLDAAIKAAEPPVRNEAGNLLL